MIRQNHRYQSFLGVALIAALLSGSACSLKNDPDPGNRRLAALKREPARKLVAPGTQLRNEVIRPRNVGTGDWTDHGDGPEIIRSFSVKDSSLDSNAIYSWFEAELAQRGWKRNPLLEGGGRQTTERRGYQKNIQHWCALLVVSVRPHQAVVGDVQEANVEIFSAAPLDPDAEAPC